MNSAVRVSSVLVLLAPGPLACTGVSPQTERTTLETCEVEGLTVGVSPHVPTVGIVEGVWSGTVDAGRIVYKLDDAQESETNRGGVAPVRLDSPNFRTLLLGLKQERDYSFHLELDLEGRTCRTDEYQLHTGRLETDRKVEVTVVQPALREPGFIVTSSGTSLPNSAFIIDADGDLVWYMEAPSSTTRALLDYAGEYVWMLSLNLLNQGGEMRFVSLDGVTEQRNVPGLDSAHHDFTVLPDGSIAAIAWDTPGVDTESRLLLRSPDGAVTSPFRIGANLYLADSFHANAIHYIPLSDSYTVSDRNPSVFVNVSSAGAVDWQLGGNCAGAPARTRCAPMAWEVTHGHHLTPDGRFVVFNNTYTQSSRILEFQLEVTPSAFEAQVVRDYTGTSSSSNLGDVQRLPGGNTLVTYSASGTIVELDADWQPVQVFATRVGYVNWRPTLYGPPIHL